MSVQAILIKADAQAYRLGFETALAGMATSAKYFREQEDDKSKKIAARIENQMLAIAEYVGALEAMILDQETAINETKLEASIAYQKGFAEAQAQAERKARRLEERQEFASPGDKEWYRIQAEAKLKMQMPHLF